MEGVLLYYQLFRIRGPINLLFQLGEWNSRKPRPIIAFDGKTLSHLFDGDKEAALIVPQLIAVSKV